MSVFPYFFGASANNLFFFFFWGGGGRLGDGLCLRLILIFCEWFIKF